MATRKCTLKVFITEKEQDLISKSFDVLERYEGFVIINVAANKVRSLARKYPVEDITDQYSLRVSGRKINTNIPRIDTLGKQHTHSAYKNVKKLSPGKHHYLVQFIGPIKSSWLSSLKRLGAEPREPYQNFTYVVCCDDVVLKKITHQRYVRWVGHLPHAGRLQLGDTKKRLPRTRVMENVYTIELFSKDNVRPARSALRKLGIKVLKSGGSDTLLSVEIDTSKARTGQLMEKISTIHGVRAVREHVIKRTSNDIAAGIMDVDVAQGNSLGLTGKNEIVAVCDTGLDTGNSSTIHDDFKGRIVAMRSYPITPTFSPYINNAGGNDGVADLDSGHGTHVAGSVLGSGASSTALSGQAVPIRGLAYESKLVFQAIEQKLEWKNFADEEKYGLYVLAGIPDDLSVLFTYAYNKGARIHSNSWGGGNAGEYDNQSYQLDEFVWNKKDFCIVVSAGNDGTDKDGDGKINPMSVTSPATAKNCITVGASENKRPQFNSDTYGEWWPTDYPVSPYKNAPMANGINQVVAFSSRGPTQDGRIKPDVIAPGTFILSTRSRKIPNSHTGWAPFPSSKQYFYMGGTSMATPLVSGAAAILRQFLRKWVGYTKPSAALVKSSLILGATKLTGYSSPFEASDNDQGYGRVNIDAVVAPPSHVRVYFLDDTSGLRTGQSDEFSLRVTSSSSPLRTVMAYSDYPGSPLVNNLNLMLIDPKGKHYIGNGSAGGILQADSTNNVEVIHVRQPRVGSWKLRVVASNVPHGPQDFALALSGRIRA